MKRIKPTTNDITASRRIYGKCTLINADTEKALARIIQADLIPFLEIPPSTPEDQARFRKGIEAKHKLEKANLRLVTNIAAKYRDRGTDFEDLIQYGEEGLSRAAEKFDPEKGFKFSTYAHWWIRQAITRGIGKESRTIRLPIHVYDAVGKMRKVRQQLKMELRRNPTLEEIAARMSAMGSRKYTAAQVELAILSESHCLSLDKPVQRGDENSACTLGELIPVAAEPDAPELETYHQIFERLLSGRSDLAKEIYCHRHGILGYPKLSIDEIAERLQKSKTFVRKQLTQTGAAMRRHSQKSILKQQFMEAL